MREGWKEVRLNEVVWFQRGFDLPKSKFSEGDIPVYGSTSILGYHSEAKVKAPGVITGRSGTLGKFQLATKNFWPHNTTLWVKDFKGNDVLYCYYMLQCLDFAILNTGRAVPTLNRNLLNSFIVNLPPLLTQRRIASILSAYDDLIENNLKRIKLLEEKAQLTYEEWFVRMKFPGYENTPVEEETGLPEGWEYIKLVDCCKLTMGQSPKSEYYNDEGLGLPFHQGVKDYGFRFPINSSWSSQGNRFAEEDAILFSVRAPVGRLNVAMEKIILGRGLASINHKKGWNSFLFYQLKKIFFQDNLMGGGAIFSSVTKKDVEGIKLLHATDKITNEFNKIALAVDKTIKSLTNQNQLLKEARDILLPRLMSGVIKV